MVDDCIHLLRTGCVISVGGGAYLHFSYRTVIDWAWPASCPIGVLTNELKALRGDLASIWGTDTAHFPYEAVLVRRQVISRRGLTEEECSVSSIDD